MRNARTIGIKEDGKEVVIHPRSTPIGVQIASFRELAAKGIPKEFVEVEFQTSDGRARSLRNGISAGLKTAQERAEDKEKNRAKWVLEQKKAREAKEKKEAEERQKRIDAANAEKEARKKAVLAPAKT